MGELRWSLPPLGTRPKLSVVGLALAIQKAIHKAIHKAIQKAIKEEVKKAVGIVPTELPMRRARRI
jgi:hypothetical protein